MLGIRPDDLVLFSNIPRKIDPTIQDQCIKQTFLVFDDKNTGSITFEQFKAILQPEAVSQPPAVHILE
jgi:Ca2+-binding EF-hand superfamily protein